MTICLAHAAVGMEIDSCKLLAVLGLGSRVEDALDELLLLGELILRGKDESLLLFQTLLAKDGLACVHLR